MKRNLLSFVFVFILGSLVFSCGSDQEVVISPEMPVFECSIAVDSSMEGVITVTADSNNRISGISNNFNNPNLVWAADSVVFTTSTRTEQSKEVLYRSGALWNKSVIITDGDLPPQQGGAYFSVVTYTPTYNNGKIVKIKCDNNYSKKENNVIIPMGTQNYEYLIAYNSDGNVSEIILRGPEILGGSFSFNYGTTTISNANVLLFKNAFEPAFPFSLPFIMGYFVPFNKMPSYMGYGVGAIGGILFSNVRVDNNNNVTEYEMQGIDFSNHMSGKVKTTYRCN